MIDLLIIATSMFAAPPRFAAQEPSSRAEQGVASLHESWEARARLQERQASDLLKEFKATASLYKEAASGDAQADSSILDAVTAVARAYHAARAKADVARRFADFLEDAPSVTEGQAWIAAETGRMAAIDGKTRELQQGLILLAGNGVGPGGMSDQWSAVLAAEGWRAGLAGELRLIGRALTLHYAQRSPSAPDPDEPAEEVALMDGI